MTRSKGDIKSADFYFYHGWAFPPGVWNSVINLVKSQLQNATGINPDFYINNRGYFSYSAAIVRMRQGDLQVVVTHSLGLHFVPVSLLHKADLIVSISGFHYFHQFEEAKSKKIVTKMLELVLNDPGKLLKEFYSNVFLPNPLSRNYMVDEISHTRTNRLYDDLQLLHSNKLSERIFPDSCKILLFHGLKDRIVDVKHTREWMMGMNQTSGRVFDDGSHALPVTHADDIVQGIIQSIKNIIS